MFFSWSSLWCFATVPLGRWYKLYGNKSQNLFLNPIDQYGRESYSKSQKQFDVLCGCQSYFFFQPKSLILEFPPKIAQWYIEISFQALWKLLILQQRSVHSTVTPWHRDSIIFLVYCVKIISVVDGATLYCHSNTC